MDNGLDQTLIQRVITKQEKKDVEEEFLSLLGLSDRPPVHPNKQVQKSAPRFLLDIYENALHEEDHPHRKHIAKDEFGLSGQDLRAIDQSDVIMSFSARSEFFFLETV